MFNKLIWVRFLSSAIIVGSLCFGVGDVFGQSEMLNEGQSGVAFSGGFVRSIKSNVSLTTVGFSAALYGRLDIGYQRVVSEGSTAGASMAGALHLLKPSPGYPLGTAFTVAVGDEGKSVFYGGGAYVRVGKRGNAKVVPNVIVGVTRVSKWSQVRNYTTLIGGVTLASEVADGVMFTFSPQFQWQEDHGSIIGFQFGVLMFDKEPVVERGLDGMEDEGL